MKGYIQVYTGSGKGKTTAAIGLALRSAGAGKKVFIGQFLKSGACSEIKALKKAIDLITVEHYGTGTFVSGPPGDADLAAAKKGYDRVSGIIQEGAYALVILDEANLAVEYNLFTEQDLLFLFDAKPEHVELVVTGRKATPGIIDRADLVIEMKAVKHYFQKGVKARPGIEI